MVWAKFDDQYPHHPKLSRAADLSALGFDVAGVCYSNRHLTDGFIADHDLPFVYPPLRNPKRLADKLVDVERWERDDEAGGYRIHDFHEYNPTREEVEADRAAARERMARNRAGKRGRSHDVRANNQENIGRSSETPTPTRPDPGSVVDTSPPPPRVLQLSLGGGGGEIERTREAMRAEGIADDVAEEAIAKARLRAVDGEVSAFTPYALTRARNLMAERERQRTERLDPVRVQERAYVAALHSGELDETCDHALALSDCTDADCIGLRTQIVERHAERVVQEASR